MAFAQPYFGGYQPGYYQPPMPDQLAQLRQTQFQPIAQPVVQPPQMQQLNNMAMQAQNCCCETQRAIDGVNYNMATNTCALQNTMNNNTRDIIDNANANSRAILDYLCQDKISTLQAENQSLRLAASQANQNAVLQAAMDANTAEILRRTAPLPVPAYQVANPYTGVYGSCCNPCGC